MFCKKCGFKLDDDANFCVKCGTTVSEELKRRLNGSAPVSESAAPVREEIKEEPVSFSCNPTQESVDWTKNSFNVSFDIITAGFDTYRKMSAIVFDGITQNALDFQTEQMMKDGYDKMMGRIIWAKEKVRLICGFVCECSSPDLVSELGLDRLLIGEQSWKAVDFVNEKVYATMIDVLSQALRDYVDMQSAINVKIQLDELLTKSDQVIAELKKLSEAYIAAVGEGRLSRDSRFDLIKYDRRISEFQKSLED